MKLSKEMSLEESFAAFGDKVAAVRCSKCAFDDRKVFILCLKMIK